MRNLSQSLVAIAFAATTLGAGPSWAEGMCKGFGPQTPRDIANVKGSNARVFTLAPAASKMNLCNIHTHTNAEHKGPGFSVFAGDGEHGGYKCNESDSLTEAELKDPADGHGAFHGIKPGDTIEVHWVHTSCDVSPGKGLGSCLSDACANPQLRVETQVFLVVNDADAAKALHGRGVNFVDTRPRALWSRGRVPGAHNLSFLDGFDEVRLLEIANKAEEVVIYGVEEDRDMANAAAKAVVWGFQKVYYLDDGFHGWKSAGFPIEKSK